MTWRVAYSLDTLLAEINTAAPNRNKASDGSIGDAAHASRTSDHNPWVKRDGVGIVRARDFTHDPAGGLDCQRLADHLATMLATVGPRHPALGSGAYIIWRRRILSRDRASEGWRTYTGSNPHDHHLHLSVALAASGYDSRQPWGWGDEEDPMAQYADQLDRIERKIDAARERDRRRQQVLVKRLRAIASEVRDDATKDQIKRVRADIAALADDLAADEATEDA